MSAPRLKILQVSYDLKIGGLQRVVLELSQSLRELGQEVHVCSLRGEGPLMEEFVRSGIPTYPLPHTKGKVDRLKPFRIFRLLLKGGYHVVHTHNTQPFVEAGPAALAARTPVRIHTDHNRVFPDRLRYMLMERAASWIFDKVVGVSDYTARNLHKYEGISPSKLMTIMNGIRPDPYLAAAAAMDRESARRECGLGGFTRVFGLGARLEPLKGLAYLLDAFPAVLARHPGAGLALAGPGSEIPALQERSRRLGIEDKVRFLPPSSSLASFYPLLDFLVLPSLSEGMPICILEAMCLGLPIIATRVGGIPEIIRHRENGLLVEPADSQGLSEAMLALLDDPALAGDLARTARDEFQAKYQARNMAANYLGLYRGSMGKGDGRG